MKNDPAPHNAPGAPVPGRHQYQHETPTVIHDPEQDMMLLARWAHRALKDPAKLWGWVLGGVAAILAAVIVYNLAPGGGNVSSAAWTKLDEARSADDKLEVAKANPNSPAAPWARLDAAMQLYQSGVADLPSNSDAALQTLKKSADLFEEIARSEPKDSAVAVVAAFGLGRCLEARNELPKAIDQYKLVASTWPDSVEAAEAKKLADVLQKPEAAEFYKNLYAFTPTKVSLPPLGTESLDFPDVVPAPTDAAAPASSLIPPPPPTAQPEEPKAEEAKPEAEAPKPEEAKPADAPKAEEAKPEAPKPEEAKPADAPKAEEALPADVFKADEAKPEAEAPKP
jgi:tetratricopeptide (TPR) repeat protein